jgi:hypothetical protein
MSIRDDIYDIEPDEDWDAFDDECGDVPQHEREVLRIGYITGRYTDVEVRFQKKGGKVMATCSQNICLTDLFCHLLEAWRTRSSKRELSKSHELERRK